MLHESDNRWIQTYGGERFWPLTPRPEDIDIEDIAHSLAMKCRFTGHCISFYSVAQHSVLVSQQLSGMEAKWALMHDAAEAYSADVARPIKADIAQFKEVEEGILKAIATRFNLPPEIPDAVKKIDDRILLDEKRCIMRPSRHDWGFPSDMKALGITIQCWPWHRAKTYFMAEYMRLFG